MSCRDMRIGVFYSPHMAGDVKLEYCCHQQMLVLKYHTEDGVMLHSYDVTSPVEMSSMVSDAIAIAAESVKDRRG